MNADRINRWLTLGANFGVLVGIILLVAELNRNSTLMRAQIFNERATQGIELFMSVADSRELSEIEGLLVESGFPENTEGFSTLTRTQVQRYLWFIRADRFRIENLLYQQTLGVLEYDPGPVGAGRYMIKKYEAIAKSNPSFLGLSADGFAINRLRRLVSEVEELHQSDQ